MRYILLALVAVVAIAAPASAASWDVSTITFDMTPIYAAGLAVLVLVASLVVFRKLKSIFSRG